MEKQEEGGKVRIRYLEDLGRPQAQRNWLATFHSPKWNFKNVHYVFKKPDSAASSLKLLVIYTPLLHSISYRVFHSVPSLLDWII